MLIIGDELRRDFKFPWVTLLLVFFNIVVFVVQAFGGNTFTYGFSLIPAEITKGKDLTRSEYVKMEVPARDIYELRRSRNGYVQTTVEVPQAPGPFPIYLTLFTSMFMHVNLVHLLGNMWFLGVFGRNVEHALDHGRFFLFYVACGIAGALAHVASDADSVIPCMGASAAISGLLAAYVAIFPLNRIKVWLGWYIGVIEMPAIVAVGIWFLVQYISAFTALELGKVGGGTAYWAHLGGFAAGLIIIWGTILFLKLCNQSETEPEEDEDQAPQESESQDRAVDLGSFLPEPLVTTMQEKPQETGMAEARPVDLGQFLSGSNAAEKPESANTQPASMQAASNQEPESENKPRSLNSFLPPPLPKKPGRFQESVPVMPVDLGQFLPGSTKKS